MKRSVWALPPAALVLALFAAAPAQDRPAAGWAQYEKNPVLGGSLGTCFDVSVLPANPILRPGKGQWDQDAVYKPYAILDGRRWLLWYNGRRGGVEQIGLARHDGEDLGF